jgi:hypothetical protein
VEVITFVKGKVPHSKKEEFEAGYETLKEDQLPEGFDSFILLHDTGNKEPI